METLLQRIPLWPLVAAYLLLALLFAIIVRSTLLASIQRARPRLDPHIYEVLRASLPRPAGATFFLFAVSAGLRWFPLPEKLETLTKHVLPTLLGTLAVLVMMRIALKSIDAYSESNPALKSTAGMGKAIAWIAGLALIAVVVSDAIGVSLAPALTALGVGSLAVALALQDTLSNFFSGVYLILDKPIRPGDFIRISEGQEGYVETIGWRSTHLRTLVPSRIIVPNATLSKAVITNYHALNPRLAIGTQIEVAFESDPAQVQRVLTDEAKTIADIKGVAPSPAPTARFVPGFGERGLAFTMYCTITAGTDAGLVQQEVRTRAISRLRKEAIPLAAPNPFGASVKKS